MKNLDAYRRQINELNELVTRLEQGELMIDELLQMEKITGELHAKSIILRYKAFEDQAHGTEEIMVVVTPEEEVKDEPAIEMPEPDETPDIDFSIFDTEEDLTVEAPVPHLFEEETAPEPWTEPTRAAEPAPVPEPEFAPAPEVKETPPPAVAGTSFWEQVKKADNSLSSRFAEAKLDTLIGAFGLNEKLRFINELFDGSSEMFSDAIKLLDAQSDMAAARQQIDDLARTHTWDPEEEVVVEFITYVNRRYA